MGIRFSLDGETDCCVGPAALLAMTKNEPVCRRRGGPMWPPAVPSPWGEGDPQGRMGGALPATM